MLILIVISVLIAGLGFGGLFLFYRYLKRQNPSLEAEDHSNGSKPVQDFFGIKGIDRGILVLSGGRYRVFIEGQSLNIPLMSEEEQDALEGRFARMLARVNFPIQFYSQTRPLDMAEVMEQLSDQYDHAPENLISYAEYLKSYLLNLAAEHPIWVRRKVICIPYDNPDATVEDAISVLDSRARLILAELKACGIDAKCLNTEEIVQVWYTFLNKQRVISQPFRNVINAGHTATYVQGGVVGEDWTA